MHKVFVDLGYGDAGKGISVARAVSDEPNSAVVKFAGGAQCAHNVIIGDKHHTFSQFGSGTLLGAPTLLTDDFIIDVPAMLREADHLVGLMDDLVLSPLRNMYISDNCLVITAAMVAANRHLEDGRGRKRHGSTGRGIGTTVAYDVETGQGVRAKDLYNDRVLFDKINAQRLWLDKHYGVVLELTAMQEMLNLHQMARTWLKIGPETVWVEKFLDADKTMIFEGSQGVLLDENIGFFPHVTRATTTSRNATRILDNMGLEYQTYGIVRTYMTRHGAGPLPTEHHGLGFINDGDHNGRGKYQGQFRRGYFDVSAIQYALTHQWVDGLIVTHSDIALPLAYSDPYEDHAYGDFADRMEYSKVLGKSHAYEIGGMATPAAIGSVLNVPVHQVGYGPELYDMV